MAWGRLERFFPRLERLVALGTLFSALGTLFGCGWNAFWPYFFLYRWLTGGKFGNSFRYSGQDNINVCISKLLCWPLVQFPICFWSFIRPLSSALYKDIVRLLSRPLDKFGSQYVFINSGIVAPIAFDFSRIGRFLSVFFLPTNW